MKKISYCFLFLLVCFGCGDESSNEDEIVQDSVEDEIVVETDPKKDIVWKKDGKEMTLIPAGSFEIDETVRVGYSLPVYILFRSPPARRWRRK